MLSNKNRINKAPVNHQQYIRTFDNKHYLW